MALTTFCRSGASKNHPVWSLVTSCDILHALVRSSGWFTGCAECTICTAHVSPLRIPHAMGPADILPHHGIMLHHSIMPHYGIMPHHGMLVTSAGLKDPHPAACHRCAAPWREDVRSGEQDWIRMRRRGWRIWCQDHREISPDSTLPSRDSWRRSGGTKVWVRTRLLSTRPRR